MNMDAQECYKLKLTKVILRKSQNPITMNPLKAKKVEIYAKSNNDESPIRNHKKIQYLWCQYFRDGKYESYLIKENHHFS